MKLDLNRILAIDFLIRHKSTASPDQLAEKLSISKRTLHYTISAMKEEFNAPIEFCKHRKTYYYKEKGSIIMSFQRKNDF